MKSKLLLSIAIFLVIQPETTYGTLEIETQSQCYSWAVVGAGFAGITAVAVLIESGIEPSTITWIDPEFNVGRVGKYYRNVPGNVTTNHLITYVNNCPFFKEIISPSRDTLYTYNLEQFQPLHVIVDPLIDFTAYLGSQVATIKNVISSVDYNNDHWVLTGTNCTICAQKVILAIGAEPKRLNYDLPIIPLDDALDKNKLATCISPSDCIAVFGGMHSAILILKHLSECFVKRIINFYIEPYFYDAPGLEGATALWAQNVLEQNPPSNLIRLLNTAENREHMLPICTKAIYAIGYETAPILVNGTSHVTFDEYSGMIAPDLYGIGIAFPPTGIINGQKIAKNGLYAYLIYAKKLIPQWITNEKSESICSYEIGNNQDIPWI